jgi:hypothetical protein
MADEGGHQVGAVGVAKQRARAREQGQVEPRRNLQARRLPLRPLDLPPRQRDEAVEVAFVSFDQQGVAQHGQERGRERERQAEADAVADEPVEHVGQRHVRLGDGLEEPALFVEVGMFGMAHVRQVRVQDGTPVPGGRRAGRHRD